MSDDEHTPQHEPQHEPQDHIEPADELSDKDMEQVVGGTGGTLASNVQKKKDDQVNGAMQNFKG